MQAYRIKAVLFDFDGTLTEPGAIDFPSIKRAIGCPLEQPVLEYIAQIEDPRRKAEAQAVLHTMEMAAARRARPNGGVHRLLRFLKEQQLPVGILTRNSLEAVSAALEQFAHLTPQDFDVIITRDDPVRPKPHPDGVRLAADRLGVDTRHLLVVGDFHFDIEAGRRAGALTAWLEDGRSESAPPLAADFRAASLAEVGRIVHLGLPLPNGKFPSDLLDAFFGHLAHDDPRYLTMPGIGEDTAAIDMTDRDTLVVTSDPITFVTERIGYYTVVINANDIATSGAVPEWLLTTLLFPGGTTPSEALAVMSDIETACRQGGITLCGGHTEITDAVSRPVVVGTLGAALSRRDLLDKRNMRTGDRILLTKGIAVEGTAIIAQAFADRLAALGMRAEEIEAGRTLVEAISILPEAAVARRIPGVTAMHDVTEGGVATAIHELSCAGGHQVEIHLDRIPILPLSERIGALLGIDPLGLIGSGTLLIVCRADSTQRLEQALGESGIKAACIGQVTEPGRGVRAYRNGEAASWPQFAVDEITRLFS